MVGAVIITKIRIRTHSDKCAIDYIASILTIMTFTWPSPRGWLATPNATLARGRMRLDPGRMTRWREIYPVESRGVALDRGRKAERKGRLTKLIVLQVVKCLFLVSI
jgi:hypothetical protein